MLNHVIHVRHLCCYIWSMLWCLRFIQKLQDCEKAELPKWNIYLLYQHIEALSLSKDALQYLGHQGLVDSLIINPFLWGVEKSIPDAPEIFLDPGDFPPKPGEISRVEANLPSSIFLQGWIRKSFPVGRAGLTVLKSILLCWWCKNALTPPSLQKKDFDFHHFWLMCNLKPGQSWFRVWEAPLVHCGGFQVRPTWVLSYPSHRSHRQWLPGLLQYDQDHTTPRSMRGHPSSFLLSLHILLKRNGLLTKIEDKNNTLIETLSPMNLTTLWCKNISRSKRENAFVHTFCLRYKSSLRPESLKAAKKEVYKNFEANHFKRDKLNFYVYQLTLASLTSQKFYSETRFGKTITPLFKTCATKKKDDRKQPVLGFLWMDCRAPVCVSPKAAFEFATLCLQVVHNRERSSSKYHTCDSTTYHPTMLWYSEPGGWGVVSFLAWTQRDRVISATTLTPPSLLVCCRVNWEPQMIVLALTTYLNQVPGNLEPA